MVPVSLYQTSLGTVNDTLYVYSSVDTVQRCLTANIVGASDISVSPSSIEVTVNKCNGFTTVPYTITNNGQAQLSYAVDVAEIYDSSYTQTWLYPAPNYSNTLVYNFNNIIDSDTIFYEIILNGEYSQTNNYFAMKAIRKDVVLQHESLESLKVEKLILLQVQHPFIISMEQVFSSETRIYFVMQFVQGGELFKHLSE